MASACNLFDKDVVYRVNKKRLVDLGLVLENSDFINSDEEESDDPDLAGFELIEKEHVRVAWHPNGTKEVLPEKKVCLWDRSLMPGVVVKKLVEGKSTQFGYCIQTVVKADVQVIGTGKVILGVDSRNLIPLKEFVSGVAFKDPWIGTVNNVKSELTLVCSDGSRCVMSEVDAFKLDDVLDRRARLSVFKKHNFYPGQELYGPTCRFKKVKWLSLTKKMSATIKCPDKRIYVTVEDVKMASAHIQWVYKTYHENNAQNLVVDPQKHNFASKKHNAEDLKSIKMVNIFKPCAQIGNRNFLIMRKEYEVVSFEEWENRMSNKLNIESSNVLHKTKPNILGNKIEESNIDNLYDIEYMSVDSSEDTEDEISGNSSFSASVTNPSTSSSISLVTKKMPSLKPGEKLVTEILVTETKVDVVWQDGTVEQNILSTSLYPVTHLNSQGFFEIFPGDYVIDSREPVVMSSGNCMTIGGMTMEAGPSGSRMTVGGMTTKTNSASSRIYFNNGTSVCYPTGTLGQVGSAKVSVYSSGPRKMKESRPYEYGVVKQVDHSGQTALITWMKTFQAGEYSHSEILSEEAVSLYDVKYHPDFQYRPGSCVIGVGNSKDTNIGFSAGQVVYARPTGKVEVFWSSGKASLCYPQELYRLGKYCPYGLLFDFNLIKDSSEKESETSVVGKEDEPGKKEYAPTKDLEKVGIKQEDKGDRAGISRLTEVFTRNPTLLTCNKMQRLLDLYKSCKYYLAQSSQPVGHQEVLFTKSTFSMLKSVPDQHKYKHYIFKPASRTAFCKNVSKEMNILRSSLPEGIIVKGFEDRIDLYSVLIKGPEQTPYEDCLFFFDFRLPADYPKTPPHCHYISYCSQCLNPNLYVCGKVCVSLLGTWQGKGIERWSPGNSNLNQVVISIQGLILVAEPYYNEPGFASQRGTQRGQQQSQMYNESVIVNLVQAMTKLINDPPEIFKQEIYDHFQTNASKFVQRLENWIAVSKSWNSNRSSSLICPSTSKGLQTDETFAQDIPLPEFPLLPISKGYRATLKKYLINFKKVVSAIPPSVANS